MENINEHTHDEQIDRYLNNRLNADESSAFEVLMMEDSGLFERVQLLDAMKQGLLSEKDTVFETGVSTPNTEPAQRKTAVVLPFSAWLRQPMSLAASLLIAVLGIQTFNEGFLAPRGQSGAMPIGSLVLIEGTRSGTAATFTGPGPYLFQIDAGLGNQAEAFAVTVRDNDTNAQVVHEENLRADNNGWVRLVLSDQLQGEYTLELSWLDAQGVPQTRSSNIAINN